MTKFLSTIFKITIVPVIFVLMAAFSHAQQVSQVTVVTPHDTAAYTEQLKDGKALLARLGSSGSLKAWQATIAGTGTGNIAVVVEWADMAAFAADSEIIQNNAEWAAWLAGLGEIRTIYSVGLYREIALD